MASSRRIFPRFLHRGFYSTRRPHTTTTPFSSAQTSATSPYYVEQRTPKSLQSLQTQTNELLQWCRDNHESERSVTGNPFFEVMEGWMEYCKYHQQKRYGADSAAQLLHVMQNTPSTASFLRSKHLDVVLEAYAVCSGGTQAAQAAQQVLAAHTTVATVKSYNIVLKCWARSTNRKAGFHTQDLLQSMIQQELWPNERSLVCHFEAWEKSNHKDAPEKVSETLQQVLSEKRGNDAELRPFRHVVLDIAVFHAVLQTWVKSGRGRLAATETENLLSSMIGHGLKPTTRTYSLLISAWAQCERKEMTGDAALRAESILREMIRTHRTGQSQVVPNTIIVTTCISAWSHVTGKVEAPEHAERLFQELGELYEESGGNPEFKPTTTAANAVLSAWSRSKCRNDCVSRALGFFRNLKEDPDLISYNTVLGAMAKQGKGNDALQFLEDMKTTNENIKPDVVSYNSVLAALSRDPSCPPQQAEDLLLFMGTMDTIQPDKMSYTSVLNAWALSHEPEKAKRAYELVKNMVCFYQNGISSLKPDVHVFSTLIKACARSTADKEAALGVALKAMDALEHEGFGPPNHVTYSLLINAIQCLSTKNNTAERNRLFEKAFYSCAKSGLVSAQVVQEMNRTTVGKQFTKRLDPRWSVNVYVGDRPM